MKVECENMHNSPSRTTTILRWIARIWSLPAIIFMAAEILFPHSGDEAVPFLELLSVGLLILAVLGLALAWRWEILGATVTLLTLVSMFALSLFLREVILQQIGLIILGFIVAPAALFLFCGIRARKAAPNPI